MQGGASASVAVLGLWDLPTDLLNMYKGSLRNTYKLFCLAMYTGLFRTFLQALIKFT